MSRRKKVVEVAPVELEVMEVHAVPARKFVVTAFTTLPADHLKDEPQIREEIEACSGSAAGLQMMRMHRHPSYFYMKIQDISPPKKRRSHVESIECDEEQLSEESEE